VKGKIITEYIWLGLQWRYLQDAEASFKIHGDSYILANIRAVFRKLQDFGLPVTVRAAKELKELEDKFEKMEVTATLTTEQAKSLNKVMSDLQMTLLAETNGIVAYIVTEKRMDINKLLSNAAGLFAPNVFDSIPEVPRSDFDEAGKCIAFGRPTAGAFHILRGTEGVLRWYYCSIVRRDRLSPLLWGPMTNHLRKRRTPPSAELLNNLDNIRLSFRNPTQHPEKTYDIQEVQDLFSLCIDVVNRMVKLVST
jgi:hypothetical protein